MAPRFAGSYAKLTDPAQLSTSADGVSKVGAWTPGRGHRLPPPSKVVSRFASGHGWSAGTDDTTTKLFGDRSYRGVTNGAGASLYLASPTFTAQDWSASVMRVVVRVDDPAKMLTFQLVVSHGVDGSAVENVHAASAQHNLIAGEWGIVTFTRAMFARTQGSVTNWANVTKVQVRFQDKSGAAPITVNLAAVELLPDLNATYPAGVFVLEADDGYAGQFTNLLPVVSARGIPVTYNVIAERFVGASPASTKTAADLCVLQDKHGWQISNHAYAQTAHNGPSTAADMEADFQREKQWLHANGLHHGADDLALCPGTGSPVAEGAMMDAIRRSFRSARVNGGFYETAIPADQLRLRSILFTGNSNAQLQANIDAVAVAGGALILTLHDVIAGGTNGTSNSLPAIAATNLATVLDYAATKGMAFRTRGDWLDRR